MRFNGVAAREDEGAAVRCCERGSERVFVRTIVRYEASGATKGVRWGRGGELKKETLTSREA